MANRAEALVQEALLLIGTADHRQVDDRLSQAINIWIQIREPEKAALSSLLIGDSYKQMNRIQEALHYYTQALEVKPISSQVRAKVFNSMAMAYQMLYHLDLARSYYTKAINQAQIARDTSIQTESLIGLAMLHYQWGDLKSASTSIEQAQRLNRGQRDNRQEARLLHMTGRIAQEQGLADKARDALNKALAIYQKTDDEAERALVLVSISSLHLSLGDMQAALDQAQQAVDIVEKRVKQSRGAELRRMRGPRWRALFALARAQRAIGLKDKARGSYYRATSHIESIWLATTLATNVGAYAFGEER